jgi:biotin carboxyl carrier protein
MDGIVVKVDAAQGDPVDRHAVLIVIEAMKMQIPVSTAHAGHVRQVLVREGDSVTSGQQLIELTDEPSAGSAAGHQPSAG